jgi:hypothetical protein
MRIHHLIIAAVLASAASANAKPRRIVILDFEGPRLLADQGRSAVVQVLNDTYDVVSTKRWQAAKMAAVGRGPLQWSMAAKASGVDAVVDGWVDPEGMRTHTLTVAVSDAMTGRQIDTVSIKITDKGVVSDDATKKLTTGLDDLLQWVDSEGSESGTPKQLPSVIDQPTLGVHQPKPEKPAVNCDDGDDDDDSDCGDDNTDDEAPRHHRSHSHSKHHKHKKHHQRRGDDDDDDDDDRRADKHSDDKKPEAKSSESGDKTTVAAADSATVSASATATDLPGVTDGTRQLIDIFGPDSVEVRAMTGKNPLEKPHPSPRFELSLGGFVAERGMSFQQDPPDFPATPPSYPSTGLDGLAMRGAVYPFPVNKNGWDLTGIGFEFTLQQSLGASLGANDTVNDTYGQYSLSYTAWEGGIHYRYPLGSLVTLDGSVNYGRSTYTLESDFPSSVQIPDTSYEYLSAGADIELNVTERMRISFGGRWLYLLDTGDVSSEDWYGSGSAGGLQLHLGFKVPLGDLLYLRGQVEYMRVSMDFNGDGNLSTSEDDDSLAVSNITDSSIGGNVQLGVSF